MEEMEQDEEKYTCKMENLMQQISEKQALIDTEKQQLEKEKDIRNELIKTFEEHDRQKEEVIKEQENIINRLKIKIKHLEENKEYNQTGNAVLNKTVINKQTQTCASETALPSSISFLLSELAQIKMN